MPLGTATGSYDVAWGLWQRPIGSGTRYDGCTKENVVIVEEPVIRIEPTALNFDLCNAGGGDKAASSGKNLDEYTTQNVKQDVQSTTGPVPPESVLDRDREEMKRLKSLTLEEKEQLSATQHTISGVPEYFWRHGCGPTSVGMVIGYYDIHGYDGLISGDASNQTAAVNQAIASGGDSSNPNPPGSEQHYEDYSRPEDDITPNMITDDYITNGRPAHADDCIGDYMDTSKSTRNNRYSWSWSSDIGPAFMDYVNQQDSSYNPSYTQYTWSDGTLTWDVLKNEIDDNRPMVFLVDTDGNGDTDHFVPVIGYDDSSPHKYACYTTWPSMPGVRWYNFQDVGKNWGVWGGWSLELAPSKAFTVYNDGATVLRITSITKESGSSWLSFSPTPPWEIAPGDNDEFTVTVNMSGLSVGTYSDRLLIYSNDSDKSPYPGGVYVNLNIGCCPPSAPSNFSHSSITNNSITWTWHDNSSDEGGFEGHDSSHNVVWTVPANATNHTEFGLSTNTRYTRHVHAYRYSGCNSSGSNSHSVYTQANPPEPASFSNTTTNSIQANWAANGNPSGTEYYCENTTAYTNSGWTTSTSWNSTGLSSVTSYAFRVKARNGEGVETEWTDLGSETTHHEPEVSTMLPESGPVGTVMTIGGQYFYDSGSVVFEGGAGAEILDWNDTVIHCRVPEDASTGNVVVQTPASSNPKYFTITDPNIIYVEPNHTPYVENGTVAYPFSRIQWGIDAATASDTVIVYPGRYYENINFNGKNIELTSLAPNDPNIVGETIIDGQRSGSAVIFTNGEDSNCILAGFSVMNGSGWVGDGVHGGITCEWSSPIIRNCIVKDCFGCGIGLFFSNTTISKCTISDTGSMDEGAYDGYGIVEYCGSVIVSNSTIRNNLGSGVHCDGYGEAGEAIKISDCNINNNGSYYWGGGVTIGKCPSINITNCTISNNSAAGGIFCYRYDSINDLSISDCNISRNLIYAQEAEYGGGGICLIGQNEANINNCIITNNSVSPYPDSTSEYISTNGGGVYLEGLTEANIINCIITDNSAFDGGGISSRNSKTNISNCIITNNFAESPAEEPLNPEIIGGSNGVLCESGYITIGNSLVAGNSGGGMLFYNCTSVIKNNTIVENRGDGIGLFGTPGATLTNCIVKGNFRDTNEIQISLYGYEVWDENHVSIIQPSVLSVSYSDVQGGEAGVHQDSNCTLSWCSGNLDADPCFVKNGYWDPNGMPEDANDDFWVNGDYHLLPDSPCIDAGDPNYPEDANEFDIDGDIRIIGGRIDIGADEYAFGELLDFSGNGIVNFGDFAILANYWLQNEPLVDIAPPPTGDGKIDYQDIALLADHWLEGIAP